MKRVTLAAMIAIFSMAFFATTASAQERPVVEVKGKAAAASRGNNPNIKSKRPTVDKEETKDRSAACDIYFSNYTGYYVDVYVAGYYRGTMAPYGYLTVGTSLASPAVYCVTSGGKYEWNFVHNCATNPLQKLYL
ncbi:hypothetical protein JMG10_15170 [Nostoc ellipsosporum NOK]|jgi:hypothetical protein|nr:hypothetical protein [Nostoc ellipsosporum NOK]